MTLELLHLEYLQKHPDGYRYTQFCERYREWLSRRGFTMRQEHLAGEKLYVDYAGKKPHVVDPKTGEIIEVELFVVEHLQRGLYQRQVLPGTATNTPLALSATWRRFTVT